MFFRQVLHADLGCASYVVADEGEAAVVDPKWDVDDYLVLAEEQRFEIRHVLETHNHADHVSGKGRLAGATGATIYVPAGADVAFEHEELADGDVVAVGQAKITALATPGHRPEHTAYLVADAARSDQPWLALTGDSLFVGDVGRPDLAVEPEEGARGLFRSLRRLLELDDFAETWPGHIGGSLCGGAGMSTKPGSTIGFERRFNRLLRTGEEDEFVRALTATLALQPPNFKRIVALNRGPLLTDAVELAALEPRQAEAVLAGGATLVDGRDTHDFDAAHVPGSINVTTTRRAVGTRAAWVVDPEGEVVLLASTDAEARSLARLLEAVGFRSLAGFVAGGLPAWRDAGLPVASTETIGPAALAARLRNGDVALVDVREDDEWEEGHVGGSLHLPYHDFAAGLPAPIPNGKPVVVACASGNRSSIAASLLARAGRKDVIHLDDGGIEDLAAEGIELVKGR
jgi:hydroxyacylglutathione hydrolase